MPLKLGDGVDLDQLDVDRVRLANGTPIYQHGGKRLNSSVIDVTELIDDAAWGIHQRPRSIQHNGVVYVGWSASNGDLGVSAINLSDGSIQTNTLKAGFEDDDHASPAILIRDDGHAVVFYTTHFDDTMRWVISDSPGDISSFGSENSFTSKTITYPQPIQLDNGDIRVHYRRDPSSGSTGWSFRDSTDGAGTFGSEVDLLHVGDRSVYTHPISDGTRVYYATGDHRLANPNIFAFYYDSSNDAYYQSDGTHIAYGADLPIDTLSDLTTAADLANPCKLYDHQLDADGDPVVAFTEHVETGDGGGDGDYRARWAAWDGSQWTVGSEVASMGGAMPESHYYESGLSLDDQDPSTVYVSVEIADRNYQIQEWTTEDGGNSWTLTGQLSPAGANEATRTKRGRPLSPRGHDGSIPCLWFAGEYDFYTAFDTEAQRSGK